MKLFTIVVFISSFICIACVEKYELEFLEPNIYTPCKNYPDHFIDSLFDLSELNMEQTEDGSLMVKGHCFLKKSVNEPAPFSIEVFKKVRGTWQPTVYTQKRPDLCRAIFDKMEVWHSYLKNTPREQLTCPLRKGQRLDMDITEPTHMLMPERNGEGEYKIHIEAGNPDKDFFGCVDVFAMVHKV